VLVAQFTSIAGFSLVQPFLPLYIRELGVTDPAQQALWSGIALGAMGVSFGLMAPLWGHLADRHGRKLMVARAMFGGVVTLVLMGMCRNVYELVALRILQGALTGTVTATNALVSSVVPRARMGYSLGLNQTMVIMGMSLGPWLGGNLAEIWGYRVTFFVAAGVLLVAGLVCLLGAHEQFDPAQVRDGNGSIGLREAFGRRGLGALLLVLFFISLAQSFTGPVFPLLVEGIVGRARAASATGMLLGIGGLTAGLAALVAGRLGDRKGHAQVLVWSTLLSGLVTMPHAVVTTMAQLLPLRALLGLGTGGIQPALSAMIASAVSRDMIGRAYGLTRCPSALGMAAGPMLCGVVASLLGVRAPFVVMGVLLLICAYLLPKSQSTACPAVLGPMCISGGADDGTSSS